MSSRVNKFDEFEQPDFEDYFKDKIDWKFFNYLVDKSTKYEDDGLSVEIKICVWERTINTYHWIYRTTDLQRKSRFRTYKSTTMDSIDKFIDLYEKDGIYYEVEIYEMIKLEVRADLSRQLNKEISNSVINCGDIDIETIVQPKSKS